MKLLGYLLIVFLFVPFHLKAQNSTAPDTTSQIAFVEDDPVAAMLDSLSLLTIFESNGYGKHKTTKDYSSTSIPHFPDSVIRARILSMNDQTPFEYIYNDRVRRFIDLYAIKKRELPF